MVVIGAGVVGLATARALALRGREVLVLEAAERFGTGISARNSEVVHAGIYYPPGSLKARLCVEGRERLYDFCRDAGIAHRRCGKLIVAASAAQLPELARIRAKALANGVELAALSGVEARSLEPQLQCVAALHSPESGIVDAQGLMLALLGEAERHGATLLTRSPVTGVALRDGAFRITAGKDSPALEARALVNSAGLDAPHVAALMEGFPPRRIPQTRLCKGSYFTLAGTAPFARLIYPLPEGDWLGIHLTLDLAGKARFGPDAEWVSERDYAIDPARAGFFYEATRAWWTGLTDGALAPGYVGIRPKLSGPGEPPADFRIDAEAAHGVRGLIQLFGIDSPGLTAALAIGEHVATLLG